MAKDKDGSSATPSGQTPKPVKPKAVAPRAVKPARPVKPVKPVKPVAPASAPKAAKPRRGRPPRTVAAKPSIPAKASKPATPSAAEDHEPAPAAKKPLPPGAENDPLIGTTIGRCKIEALIGVGRTARVYRAHYEALQDDVAVKILRADVAKEPQLVDRFHSEAKAIAKVDNENVPKIYDVGRQDDHHYMVVELLEGEEILDLISREGQVDVMDSLRIVRQAANGLDAAHAHRLVHRDIKPQNLFLLEDGTVKVVDFGLAARFDEDSERVGTPHYMAPEVCEAGNAESASDMYGLGIVLYHLLVGQPPYAGQDIQGILRSHVKGEALHPERRRKGLQREVSDLVRRLTKRDPLMRPTARELIDELDNIGGEELEQKESLKKRRFRGRARSAVARRERRGKKAPSIAIIAVVLVAAIGGVVAMVGSGKSSRGTPDEADLDSNELRGPETVDVPDIVTQPDIPEETPEEKEARELKVRLAARAKEAKLALERATKYARDTWRSPADTMAVKKTYMSVYDRYMTTDAGKEALKRVRGIEAKKVHPHPDREWTDVEKIQAIRDRWDQTRASVEKLIEVHDYAAAQTKIPAAVSGSTKMAAKFARELDFWREYTGHLREFQQTFAKAAQKLPDDERTLETPDGEKRLKRVTGIQFEVAGQLRDKAYSWKDIEPAAIIGLAQRALNEEDARHLILLTAFAFAHGLRDAFFDAQLLMGATSGGSAYDQIMKQYTERFRAR